MNDTDTLPKLYTALEMAEAYRGYTQEQVDSGLDVGKWLPSFRSECRPLMPGELCFIMAEPGVGKSMVLQQLALLYNHPALFFEMELPKVLMFERFMQSIHTLKGDQVFNTYQTGGALNVHPLRMVRVCDATRLNRDQMLRLIDKWRKTDDPHSPAPLDSGLVIVDYIGLMASAGKSRYERVSVAAEDLKTLAKEANVVVLAATQMHRNNESGADYEPGLHDAKDSSSIEDAADLFLAMWKSSDDRKRGFVKIVKNRKGTSGKIVSCIVEGEYMRWKELMPTASDYGREEDPS